MNPRYYTLFGIRYCATDYAEAVQWIIERAEKKQSYGVSALAVHGLVTAVREKPFGELVNRIDLVVPDGQPVRWALNLIHNTNLSDRVYGPELTLRVLQAANERHMKVFLYGSTQTTISKLQAYIESRYPNIDLCGSHPDRFREATAEEDQEDINRINSSGAHLVLVGRGCPRQEIWVGNHIGKVHSAMMAVGAAFDFIAGTSRQAPRWMQQSGLEWLFRLAHEPRRLWRRYLTTNSYFIYLVFRQLILKRKSNL